MKIQDIVYLLVGGLFLTAVFLVRYQGIDSQLYEVRDDGVITMSVGRHLVEFGFAGVSPSGPIVEASSSPLQMIIYAIAYAATGASYFAFAYFQTIVASFILGLSLTLIFSPSRVEGLVTVLLLSLGLSFVYPFFLWHGSGMENALTHVLLILSIAGMIKMIRCERITYLWVLPLVLTCFVRLELVITVMGLLGLFSLYWWGAFGRLDGLWFSIAIGLACLAGHGLRIYYFGSFFPNTAVAQAISPNDRFQALLSGSALPLYEGLLVSGHNFIKSGWWIAAMSLPVTLLLKKEREMKFLVSAALVVLAIAMASPVLLGNPRIDWGRTYSHVAPVVLLLPALCIYQAMRSKRFFEISSGVLIASVSILWLSNTQPYHLGWQTDGFDKTRRDFVALAARHQIRRPLVSNPDLGVMSWHKDHNILDLGMLGSPVMASLQDRPVLGDYVLDFARPDFIESHGFWTRKYCKDLFLDPRFGERYRPVNSTIAPENLCSQPNPDRTIWIRRSIELGAASAERRFLDKMQDQLEAEIIETELYNCRKNDGDCSYVMRTVFRFIPEVSSRGIFDKVMELFSKENERHYLSGWRDVSASRRLVQSYLKD